MAMLLMWRVLVPLPRWVRVMPSGPMRRAGWPPLPGAEQTARVQSVSAVAVQSAAVRQVEAVRRGLLEDVHPLAEHAPVAARPPVNGRLALDHDEDHLAGAGRLGDGLAGAEAIEREADVAPARGGGGDLVHLAVGAEGLAQKRARHAGVRAASRPVASGHRAERLEAHVLVVEGLAHGAVLLGLDHQPAGIAVLGGDLQHRLEGDAALGVARHGEGAAAHAFEEGEVLLAHLAS